MGSRSDVIRARLREYRRRLAPGTPIRDGLDRILRGRTGAIVVLGNNAAVRSLSTGGFKLDVEFSPQSLRELAKLDGAILLSNDLDRILAAGVHLVPPGALPTLETGTRHRSADQTSQAAGIPVVSVSASMSTITLFLAGHRHLLETSEQMLGRANQTMTTLTQFVGHLERLLRNFNALEFGEQVTIRDLSLVGHRYEMTRRLSEEVAFHMDTLGAEGRLVALQYAELMGAINELPKLLAADYAHNLPDPSEFTMERLHNFSTTELLNNALVAERLGFGTEVSLETGIVTRGIRLLSVVGRLPRALVDKLVSTFTLQELFGASLTDLQQLEGIGPSRARQIRDALLRITDDRYATPGRH